MALREAPLGLMVWVLPVDNGCESDCTMPGVVGMNWGHMWTTLKNFD